MTALLAAAATAMADSPGQDDVKSAAQKLAGAGSYSWTTTMESPQFTPGPSHGRTEKGGYTYVDFSMQDNTIESIVKDGKGAIKTEDGWQTLDEAAKDDEGGGFNPRVFLARRMQNYKTPAVEAQDIVGKVKSLAKTDDGYSGDLTEDGAKSLMRFGRGNGGPTFSNTKGTVKFWVKDGVLTKYQYHLEGTMTFNGDDNDVDRTVTVEIKDIGSTKVTIPDEAKAKLSS
jgi:hypothetical protein